MLRILIIFLVLIAGIIVGPLLANHQGSVLFQVAGYRISTSLTAFVIIEIIFCVLLYVFFVILRTLVTSHTLFSEWINISSRKKAIKRFEQAQGYLLAGEDDKALKLLEKSAKCKQNRVLSHLQAAQIEINHDQLKSANNHLEQIKQPCPPEYQFAFHLVQLKLQLKSQLYESAKENVEKLLDENPRNREVLRLAYLLFNECADYQALIEILPSMYKANAYTTEQLDKIKHVAYTARIKQLLTKNNAIELKSWWNEQPKAIRHNNEYKLLIESNDN